MTILKSRGYTLIEFIASIALITTLLATSIPSFSTLIANNELKATSSHLLNSLQTARQYAVTNQSLVQVCAISNTDNNKCSEIRSFNSNWSNGWLVFADQNANNTLDKQDEILIAAKNDTHINIVFNQRGRLRFFPNGHARSAGFYMCTKTGNKVRHLLLMYSGRSRVSDGLTQQRKSICTSIQR